MKIFYRAITLILYPIFVVIIFIRKLIHREDSIRYKEKIFSTHFNVNRKRNKKLFWFHAASIGELKSIFPLIKEFNKKRNDLEFLVTTVTLSASQIARDEFKDINNAQHRFFPLDVNFLIEKFLNLWAPDAIFLVDSEIWPNLIFNAKKREIPLALINARITKKTFLRWNKIDSFANQIFNSFDFCLSSNLETVNFLNRFKSTNVFYEGNLKLTSKIDEKKIENLNHHLLKNNKCWMASSTHEGEEIFCLKVHLILKKKLKKLLTIIAPRHIDRVKNIEKLCRDFNLSSQTVNKNEIIEGEKDIIIINSFGVLPSYYKFIPSIFIGKSFLKRLEKVGGQDPIEAAKLGCRIYHGPYVYNFAEIYKLLEKNDISKKVENFDDLAKYLASDLEENNNKLMQPSILMKDLSQKVLEKNMKIINKFLFNETL